MRDCALFNSTTEYQVSQYNDNCFSKWICLLKQSNPNTPTNIEYVGKIPLSKLSCKSASCVFVSQKFQPPTAERRMLQANLDKQTISTIYSIPFKVTKDLRLAIFQFKIVHSMTTSCRPMPLYSEIK